MRFRWVDCSSDSISCTRERGTSTINSSWPSASALSKRRSRPLGAAMPIMLDDQAPSRPPSTASTAAIAHCGESSADRSSAPLQSDDANTARSAASPDSAPPTIGKNIAASTPITAPPSPPITSPACAERSRSEVCSRFAACNPDRSAFSRATKWMWASPMRASSRSFMVRLALVRSGSSQ
ncbi:hypothetical protein X551_04508 [Methylibium sp. T29]|nr:hypothetical protein X551_04508 [Methylibium sp. T29]